MDVYTVFNVYCVLSNNKNTHFMQDAHAREYVSEIKLLKNNKKIKSMFIDLLFNPK